ncbi:MAG TPA: YihY/virulence factor BrkB family protein [Candidatus Eisenbacteria bacterium]|nr:YihY/virulence factor BrkB family protein [Candidatus Eisenbacteria bacterium]
MSAYRDIIRHHALQVAAALSYYFVLSIFPGLIFLSAMVGWMREQHLFGSVLALMSRLFPPDTMHVVDSVLHDVLSNHRGTLLSFGMIGTIWVGSTGFSAMIEALDIAYDAPDNRPYWKTRLLATGLAAICGSLLLVALAVMIVGPRFGAWIAAHLGLSSAFAVLWPPLRWAIAISFTVLAVELLYFLAPNVKQRFAASLPGAIFAVIVWNGLSLLLSLYFRDVANFSRTYGTLGGFIALMIWLYWTSFVLLVGAELNAELAKQSKKGYIQPRGAAAIDEVTQGSGLNRAA